MNNLYLAFDIDGTIYDVGDIVVPSFQEGIGLYIRTTGEHELPVPAREEIVRTLGMPMDEIFLTLFPSLPLEQRRILMDLCTGTLVAGIRAGGGYIFPGVPETLHLLHDRGYHLLVASNGREEYVRAILETWDIDVYFSDTMIFPGDGIQDKTAVIGRYRDILPPGARLVMIGDRYTDRDAAVANNIPFIGCAFGHAGVDELDGAVRIVHSFGEIPDAVNFIGNGGVRL